MASLIVFLHDASDQDIWAAYNKDLPKCPDSITCKDTETYGI